ncbi:MAG: Npt1/Npt2 family nucleotide transporter, partial [Thermodesulfobacteriota bacterium]
MKALLGRWLNIYESEIALFLWTVALMFLVRGSGMILDNYAEAAFLKRYGVEYMPIVNMVNAFATFLVMGILTGLMTRFPDATLLCYLFIFCGVSVTFCRLLIPFDIDLIYPLLFMLKAQYEVLLALLFWNLSNNLFNTRQSKRLFPLITAGGVIGLIIGSFGTPFLAKTFSFDNLLYVYLVICIAGAALVKGMSRRFPALLVPEKKHK